MHIHENALLRFLRLSLRHNANSAIKHCDLYAQEVKYDSVLKMKINDPRGSKRHEHK
jgi:hypothetical protein